MRYIITINRVDDSHPTDDCRQFENSVNHATPGFYNASCSVALIKRPENFEVLRMEVSEAQLEAIKLAAIGQAK
jgi:hypothetical protein